MKDLKYQSINIHWSTDQNGVSHLEAHSDNALAFGLGHAHAKERGLQLRIFQLILRGNLSEYFGEKNNSIETDRFMRKLGLFYYARKEETNIDEETKEYLGAYCDGVNDGRSSHYPIELKLLGVPSIKWTIADTLALAKLMGYLGLAQTQQDFEKWIAQSLAQGVPVKFFSSLVQRDLTNEAIEILELLQRTIFDLSPIVTHPYTAALPTLKNSNNWVISPKKSQENSALMACDPHLEVNRLPALWFEACLLHKNNNKMGITIPGCPGIIMGRNNDLAFSFTYGFMDTIDYFLEEIKDQKIITDYEQSGLNIRYEIIKVKGAEDQKIYLFESERGILEIPQESIDSSGQIKNGIYMARAWTGLKTGAAQAIKSIREINNCNSAITACDLAKDIFLSCNWLFTDKGGNIAFQQSGYSPQRSHSGLLPQRASDKNKRWTKEFCPEKLSQIINPETGFLVTANNDVQTEKNRETINLPVADYRAKRIEDYLKSAEKFSILQFKSLQADLYSYQAKAYMDILRPLIPKTPSGRILESWDLTYNEDSKGAFLFEKFLKILYQEVFGRVFGVDIWNEIQTNTTIMADYYGLFDRIFLEPQEEDFIWFGLEKSTDIHQSIGAKFEVALTKTLASYPIAKVLEWKSINNFVFKHILLGDSVASWLPFNKGPYPLQGSRATVCQGNLYSDRGRQSSYAPSYRMVCAMKEAGIFSVLPGGPSDRFYKKTYTTDISKWLNFQYKTIIPRGL